VTEEHRGIKILIKLTVTDQEEKWFCIKLKENIRETEIEMKGHGKTGRMNGSNKLHNSSRAE
jgi:hypothetical protein